MANIASVNTVSSENGHHVCLMMYSCIQSWDNHPKNTCCFQLILRAEKLQYMWMLPRVIFFSPGAAYAHAEKPLQEFVERCKLPFLPTPMGKGAISDEHPLIVAAARSRLILCEYLIVSFL